MTDMAGMKKFPSRFRKGCFIFMFLMISMVDYCLSFESLRWLIFVPISMFFMPFMVDFSWWIIA